MQHSEEIATRSKRYVATVSKLPAPTLNRLYKVVGLQTCNGLRELCLYDILQSNTERADRLKVPREDTNEGSKNLSFTASQFAVAYRV